MMMIYSQHQTGTCLYLKTSFLYSNNNNNNFWKSEFYVARMMTRERKNKNFAKWIARVERMELIQYHLTYVHFHREIFHPAAVWAQLTTHNFQVRYAFFLHTRANINTIKIIIYERDVHNKAQSELLSDHKERVNPRDILMMMMYEY